MKKIKVIRMSGHPIQIEDLEAFKQEWRELYDRAERKCTLVAEGDIESPNKSKSIDMLRLQKLLARVERILGKKYDTIGEWDFIKTKTQWKNRMDEYGNIMISRMRESGEMIYVIMDQE